MLPNPHKPPACFASHTHSTDQSIEVSAAHARHPLYRHLEGVCRPHTALLTCTLNRNPCQSLKNHVYGTRRTAEDREVAVPGGLIQGPGIAIVLSPRTEKWG